MVDECPQCRSIDVEDIGSDEFQCRICWAIFDINGVIIRDGDYSNEESNDDRTGYDD